LDGAAENSDNLDRASENKNPNLLGKLASPMEYATDVGQFSGCGFDWLPSVLILEL
jgi:hypothetical protein